MMFWIFTKRFITSNFCQNNRICNWCPQVRIHCQSKWLLQKA